MNITINKQITKIIISIGVGCIIIGIGFIAVKYKQSMLLKQADEAMSQQDYGKAEKLQKSKKTFDEGMKCFENKDYINAVLSFQDVIEEDITNYDNAMKKKEESKNLYESNMIELANKSASNSDYDNAVNYLANALRVDSTNNEIIDLRDKYKALANAPALAKAKADADAKALANAKAAKEYDEQQAVKAEVAKQKRKSEGVRIGMTKDEVLGSSWGNPEDINKTTTQYGTHEQWVYGTRSYLYFDDGILTSIQN